MKKALKKCPLCNKSFSSLPDKQLERILNEKVVYCANKSDGCDWKGKLAELEKHLDPKPSPDKKIAASKDGCQFKRVECCVCKEMFYRFTMTEHAQTCRQVTCTYCKTYTDAASKMEQHYSECPMYPVSCPNDCGSKPFRKNISIHVKNICPNTVVKCSFNMLRCDMKRFTAEHEDVGKHLLLTSMTIARLKEENEHLRKQIQMMQKAPIKLLCVTDLPHDANGEDLKSLFQQYGPVNKILMNGIFDVSATVEFVLEGSAELALSQSTEKGITLNSKKLSISPVYCMMT
jgi:hypothetical protein